MRNICSIIKAVNYVNGPAWKSIFNRQFSSAAKPNLEGLCTYRTNESDPSRHGADHLGQFYTMPQEVYDRIFKVSQTNHVHEKQIDYFKELAVMVRSPALEIINYLKTADYKRPVNRYIMCML